MHGHFSEHRMGLPINKGPGWNTSQYTAAAAGFFSGAGAAQVLLYYDLIPRNLAIVVVGAGLGLPPFIVGWWQKRKYGPFYNEPR
jgi:hypothetical protein